MKTGKRITLALLDAMETKDRAARLNIENNHLLTKLRESGETESRLMANHVTIVKDFLGASAHDATNLGSLQKHIADSFVHKSEIENMLAVSTNTQHLQTLLNELRQVVALGKENIVLFRGSLGLSDDATLTDVMAVIQSLKIRAGVQLTEAEERGELSDDTGTDRMSFAEFTEGGWVEAPAGS